MRARFNATVNSPGEQISFWLDADDETALKKFVGCLIISAMPEEGLNEALTSLKDVWDFHIYTPPKALPDRSRQVAAGRVVRTRKRPDLFLGE